MARTPSTAERLDVNSPQGNAIVEAASACFDRFGVERTRMGDVAAEAGIQRPTLYNYFASKESLIVEVMVRHIRINNRQIRDRLEMTGSGREVITKCLLLQIQDARPREMPGSLLRNEPLHKLAHRTATSPVIFEAVSELWSEVLGYARSTGDLRPDVKIDEAIRWITTISHTCLAMRELMPNDEELPHYLETFVVGALVN